VRLHGLLSWYDERERDLASCLAALAGAGFDHVVAIDGAYELFPGGQARSPARQRLAVSAETEQLGLGLTLHVPDKPWPGNEVEKRTALFDLAFAVSAPGDWWLVLDADEKITQAPADLAIRLARAEEDVAEIKLRDFDAAKGIEPDKPLDTTVIRLFRRQPIRLEGNHWTHKDAEGRVISGRQDQTEVPILDLTDVMTMEHRRALRGEDRLVAQYAYYQAVSERGDEIGPCEYCGKPGVEYMAVEWRMVGDKPRALLKDVCKRCRYEQQFAAREFFEALGVDPDKVVVRPRVGKIDPAELVGT
jgi:hypothetical protein